MRRILKVILVILTMVIATPSIQVIAKAPIRVIIDQVPLALDQPPAMEDGRVLLPLRGIFEALGAEVKWDDKTQSVTGTKDKMVLKLEIGKRQAIVNNERVLMDVPGKMINGRTMVPVRFVAENLGITVNWDAPSQMVIITTMPAVTATTNTAAQQDVKVQALESDITIYKSSNLKENYAEVNIKGNGSFEIVGKTISNNRYVLIEVKDSRGKEVINNQSKINRDGTYGQEYGVDLEDGKYRVNIFMHDQEYGTYQGTDTDIVIIKSKDGLAFQKSPIYKDNIQQLGKSNQATSSDLNMRSFSKENQARLLNLATNITKDKETDYYKALGIANWVSENIYYDVAAAETGKLGKTDAIGTLDEKRSICQGYAALTTGLLRSIGIPTKLVFGYALGVEPGADSWEKVDHARPNHVWNEVFVDNRWIIVDTTWNSKNTYEKGKYIEGNKIYTYFDPTVEAFSETHKITNR